MKLISMLLLAMALTLWALPGHADPAAGEAAFKAGECTACHYTDGPAKEKTIDDQLAKKGPELWYAGIDPIGIEPFAGADQGRDRKSVV